MESVDDGPVCDGEAERGDDGLLEMKCVYVCVCVCVCVRATGAMIRKKKRESCD